MSFITNNIFRDTSSNNFSIDVVGDNMRQVGISPYSSEHWSIRFNQNSSPISLLQREGDFNFRGNDFTIESWVNLDRFSEEVDEYGNVTSFCVYSCLNIANTSGVQVVVKNIRGNNFITERTVVSLMYNGMEIVSGFVPKTSVSTSSS